MTPEAQRIAIAEACGWADVTESAFRNGNWIGWKNCQRVYVPDYLNDLNAMHEAEKVFSDLSDEHWSSYAAWLHEIVPNSILPSLALTHANAAQRAEAFLRTLGLWKDDISIPKDSVSDSTSP